MWPFNKGKKEEEIRTWVRDEQARIDAEKQEACSHMDSGTLQEDRSVNCDGCGKNLVFDPNDTGSVLPNKATAAYFKQKEGQDAGPSL